MKQIFIKGVMLSVAGMLLLGGCSLKSDEAAVHELRAGQLLIGGVPDRIYFEQVPYAE